jgi:beta-lactamase class A
MAEPRGRVVGEELDGLVAAFDGEAAFLARNLTTGEEVSHRPDRVMPTASTIKVLVLAELFRQVEAGSIDLDESVAMVESDREGGSGILKDLSPSVLLPVRDHATLMIALSDNTSTAVLVRLLGRERIVESAGAWGMADTTAGFARGGGAARDYAASTPRDLVHLLELIGSDGFLTPGSCAAMRDILLTQQYHDQLGRYLPYNQYQRSGYEHPGPLLIRSKSGFMTDAATGAVRVDAGIIEVRDRATWVICCMTEGNPDRGYGPEHPGAVLNGRISRAVYDAWGG